MEEPLPKLLRVPPQGPTRRQPPPSYHLEYGLVPEWHSPQLSEACAGWDTTLEQRLQELDRRIDAICHQESAPYDGFNNKPPFDSQIMQESLSHHFKVP